MQLTSPAFDHNGYIPMRYTCDAENESPPLLISDAPEGTRSFALILHDPDAPMPGGFTHWVVWNIDPSVTEILAGVNPSGAHQGQNGSGESGYTGPCPPSGVHHYHFDLYALDTTLDLEPETTRDDLLAVIEGHDLAHAELIGLYERQ